MDEKKTTEGVKKETTTETEDEGSKYETTPVIERARQENERMEAVVKELRAENDRRERIMAKRELGGMSEAGQSNQKKEETDEEYAERFSKGEVNPLEADGK